MKDEMTDFEKQLSKALQRVEAPPALLQFLETKIQAAEARTSARKLFAMPRPWRWMTTPWAGGLVAAMLVAGVFLTGARVHQQHERQAQAQQATQQFETATQITDRAMEHAREAMKRAGVNPDQ